MVAITHTDAFSLADSPEAVLARAVECFQHLGARPMAAPAGSVAAATGSQLRMRLLGGAFISPRHLPLTMAVEARPAPDGTTAVTITVSDAVGFGLKTGMKGRYERLTIERAGELRAAVCAVSQAA